LKLRRFTIENYKALGFVDVRVRGGLLFLIGVNGAGKSSILQALSLVRYFANGSTSEFFKDRGWKATDGRPKTVKVLPLRSSRSDDDRSNSSRDLAISLSFESEHANVLWSFRWNYNTERAVHEVIWALERGSKNPRRIVGYPSSKEETGVLSDLSRLGQLTLPGSIMSIVRPNHLGNSEKDRELLKELKEWIDGITSLELLNPVTMRSKLRGDSDDIGQQGERLASFLADLTSGAKERVVGRMAKFYPIRDIDTTRKRAGWIDMRIAEAFRLMGRIDVAHMSDGFLRILALCAIPEFDEDAGLILLDEVEDGIEPHILPQLIEQIASETSSQMIMTSHSPLLINFFDKNEIYLLSRDSNGNTVGSMATDLRAFQEEGSYLGIGEIWANTASGSLYASLPRFRPPRRRISDRPTALEVLQFLRN
jgi:predicted ATPase